MIIEVLVLDSQASRLELCSCGGVDARPGRVEQPLGSEMLAAPPSPGSLVPGPAMRGDRVGVGMGVVGCSVGGHTGLEPPPTLALHLTPRP